MQPSWTCKSILCRGWSLQAKCRASALAVSEPPGSSAASIGSAPSRRMAVSHIRELSTSKTRSTSTSAISHADCASSSSSCPGPQPAYPASTRARGAGRDCSTRRSTSGDVERYRPSTIVRKSVPTGGSPIRIQPRSGCTGPPMHSGQLVACRHGRVELDHRARRHFSRSVENDAKCTSGR